MMNIMFAANDALVDGLELAIWSLLKHNHDTEVNIYVATMNIIIQSNDGVREFRRIDDRQRKWLKKIVGYVGQGKADICFLDCEELYHQYLEKSVNANTPFTPYAGLRLIADKLLPDIDDLLYLDTDTAIQGPIEGMYHKYINENPYNYAASYASKACDGKGEMVSGVLLMNLKRMRETGFLNIARDNYNNNLYRYPDQMALRDAGECMRLPETYGYMEELESCYYDPVILHFTNKLSPKIYNQSIRNIKDVFYKRYPQFKYVKDGLELLSKLDLSYD